MNSQPQVKALIKARKALGVIHLDPSIQMILGEFDSKALAQVADAIRALDQWFPHVRMGMGNNVPDAVAPEYHRIGYPL